MADTEQITETPARIGQKEPFLWKVVSRYDHYIGTTNTKAAFLIAYNTFVIGGILLKWSEIVPSFSANPKSAIGIAMLLFLLGVCAVLSLVFTFRTIYPYLKSGKSPDAYHSKIFFSDVAEYPTGNDYLKSVQGMLEADIEHDVAQQTHLLAKGLVCKFKCLQTAIGVILFGQVPILIGVLAWFTCLQLCKV